MNDDLLIANQTRKLAEQQEHLDGYKSAIDSIRKLLVCVGGPLNDNREGYTPQQLKLFHTIRNYLYEP